MRIFALLMALLVLEINAYSQDYIYFKDKTIQKGKVLEVGVDKIKYKKYDIPQGPTFEVLKSDVIKIQYYGGHIDTFDSSVVVDSSISKNTAKLDTSQYAQILIVFNDGQDESSILPLYINGNFLYTIRNHMRITYKIYSSGVMLIERRLKKKVGPTVEVLVENGKKYGIIISEPRSQGLDPNMKFSFKLIDTPSEFERFLQEDFNGFKPFKTEDIILTEKIKNTH